MFRPRVIPVLLLKDKGLVKSVKFRNYQYIGDPINAVKLFNDLNADELIFLDITATREKRCISTEFIKKVGEEANMPFAAGGGISTLEDIKNIILAGAERVVINSAAAINPEFIRRASESFGSSTICVCMDVRKNIFGKACTWIINGRKKTGYSYVDFALLMEEKGAGEIIIQSFDKDGTMDGYDINIIRTISEKISIPVVALGGAGNLDDLKEGYLNGNASGLAAGSMFVFHGPRKGVLINYPTREEINDLFK